MNNEGKPTTSADASSPGLAKSLQSRHVAMISIGGIIGAGLFVGSSAAISSIGPAIVASYLLAGLIVLVVMRMLSEMAVASLLCLAVATAAYFARRRFAPSVPQSQPGIARGSA